MSCPKVRIYDPQSGEEADLTPAAFDLLLESGVITETGAFAPEKHIKELGRSVWGIVRDALEERKPW